jgi:NAD+ synthase
VNIAIDTRLAKLLLVDFIREEVKTHPFDNAIIGVSGGIDSAVVAYLAKDALGSDQVIGIFMPYKTMSEKNRKDAQSVIRDLGISSITVDISPMVDAFKEIVEDDDRRRLGSKMIRERMSILYYYADVHKAVVLGTSNKSEDLLGYFTAHGDVAWDINPISGLYKTHIKQLGKELGVPQSIIEKKSTADFWIGQTDEQEFGFSYDDADIILSYIEKGYSHKEMVNTGLDRDLIIRVQKRIQETAHKRASPAVPELPDKVFL